MGSPVAALCAALLAAPQPSQAKAAAGQPAAEQVGQPTVDEVSDDTTHGGAGVAPVELIPRIELRHSFAQLPGGASANATTSRIDVDFLRRVLLRYELPFVRLATATGEQIAGLGDITLQAIGVVTSTPRHVAVLIAGAQLDTASQPQLGQGKQILLFGAAAAFRVRRWWLPYGIVQEQLSVAGNDARPDVNQLLLRAGNVVFGPGFSWMKLDVDATIDLRDDATTRLFVSAEAGRLLIGRVGLFIRGGTQAVGPRQLDYTLEAGVRYLFRLGTKAPPPPSQ
jgi:hypothetical protein